jgi:GR25 family glycosyltransferase involved in LPS biosynthesis
MTIDPKIYMIQMSTNKISQHYKNLVLPSWKDYNVHLYEAVTPETIEKQKIQLTFNTKHSHSSFGISFSETEKAIWYSHYNLWEICIQINKSIIVLEHDMQLVDPMFTQNFREKNGVGLGMTYSDYHKANINLPCGAYYITPHLAKVLVKTVHKWDDIKINPDGYIKKFLDTDRTNWCVTQVIDKKIGTTIIHNKK